MKIQIMSDLHFEFHPDGGKSFVESLDPVGVDVLVIAGDTGLHKGGSLHRGLGYLTTRYGDTPIVLIWGNHELYGSDRGALTQHMGKIKRDYPTVNWLEKSTVTIKGQRFVGATLWFPDTPKNRLYQSGLNDFHCINGNFDRWVYQENEAAQQFLASAVVPDDVVVTHHVPTPEGVHPKWRASPINRFFVTDMEKVIRDKGPKIWAYGHTHDYKSFRLHATRLVCNPLGYLGREHTGFRKDLVMDLDEICAPVLEPTEERGY